MTYEGVFKYPYNDSVFAGELTLRNDYNVKAIELIIAFLLVID